MKVGIRKPNYKKRLKARTTGKIKRQVKKAVIPGYGKKGTGWIKDPKKAAYNKLYNKTTVSVDQLLSSSSKSTNTPNVPTNNINVSPSGSGVSLKNRIYSVLVLLFGIILLGIGMATTFIISIIGILVVLISIGLWNDAVNPSSDKSDDFTDTSSVD